jgi:hypothetical protein
VQNKEGWSEEQLGEADLELFLEKPGIVTYSVPSTERLLNAKPFLATATEECCPARGTLAGHFTRRLSPSPMPGKRIQQQRAYQPLKRSSPRPQFYRGLRLERQGIMGMAGELDDRWLALRSPEGEGRVGGRKVRTPLCEGKVGQRAW